jgi:hypothetical protein
LRGASGKSSGAAFAQAGTAHISMKTQAAIALPAARFVGSQLAEHQLKSCKCMTAAQKLCTPYGQKLPTFILDDRSSEFQSAMSAYFSII